MKIVAFLLIAYPFSWLLAQKMHHEALKKFDAEQPSLLWKIEGKQVNKASYLFGTMHLMDKAYFFFPEKVKTRLLQSSQIIMELPGIPNQAELLPQLQLAEGSFFDFFTPQQTDTILHWAQTVLHLNETQFRGYMHKMKPFVAIQLATQQLFAGETESHEMIMEQLAIAHKIELKGLETLSDQIKLFDELSIHEQIVMVMEILNNPLKQQSVLEEIQQIYLRQQVDSLYTQIHQAQQVLPSFQAAFIDDRNARWIPKIETFIREKPCFIAVGAGHLGGPNGLIRLLKNKGYQLTPIPL